MKSVLIVSDNYFNSAVPNVSKCATSVTFMLLFVSCVHWYHGIVWYYFPFLHSCCSNRCIVCM